MAVKDVGDFVVINRSYAPSTKGETYAAAQLKDPLVDCPRRHFSLPLKAVGQRLRSKLAETKSTGTLQPYSILRKLLLILTTNIEASASQSLANRDLVDEISASLDLEIASSRRLFAAIHIQQWYRKMLALRRPVSYGPLGFLLRSAFEECIAKSNSITWTARRHRMIFLGVLPHALACLDAIIMHSEHLKANAAKRLEQAPHKDLEKYGEAVVAIE